MEQNNDKNRYNFPLESKWIFLVSLIVVLATILGVWLFGIGSNKTVFFNSLLSTTILSIFFFLFITFGLYKGITLKDNSKDFVDKINTKYFPDLSNGIDFSDIDAVDSGDGIGGFLLAILAWIFLTIFMLVVVWLFGAILWVCVFIFATILYWLFYNATKFVLRNADKCKNRFVLSAFNAFFHTLLYNFWIYLVIYFTHQVGK